MVELSASPYEWEYGITDANMPQAQIIYRILPGCHVLDVGCGAGRAAKHLTTEGCEVIGLEPGPALAEKARRHSREVIVGEAENPSVLEAIPGRFDFVVLADIPRTSDPTGTRPPRTHGETDAPGLDSHRPSKRVRVAYAERVPIATARVSGLRKAASNAPAVLHLLDGATSRRARWLPDRGSLRELSHSGCQWDGLAYSGAAEEPRMGLGPPRRFIPSCAAFPGFSPGFLGTISSQGWVYRIRAVASGRAELVDDIRGWEGVSGTEEQLG